MTGKAAAAMAAYFGSDVRRVNHALKVFGFAQAIAEAEGLAGDALAVVELSGLLHDIGIHECERKYGSTAGHLQEREGPPVAGAILERLGVPPAVAGRTLELIGRHHSYGADDGTDFRCLIEADFLVNASEDALAPEAVAAFAARHFRTAAGSALVRSLYPAAFAAE
jgi:hypothetical protein